MIDEEKLIYALQNRIKSHEIESDIIKENGSEKLSNICELYLRLADECQAIIELIELQPKVSEWIPSSERFPEDDTDCDNCERKNE